ncbi:hypothetical protein ANCCAN_15698 [Ancylostoma caninum]|uniref:Uncharacterized protein n=1 Tax=Ancylostoma caninum TaxID=29170 RepID=A0A368G1Y6_ANCCA|nr:hypothetical protein ANCCAN_15698 [Ancylostoma caninum]
MLDPHKYGVQNQTFLVLLLLLSAVNTSLSNYGSIKCLTWNRSNQKDGENILERDGPRSPQCFFAMRLPCNMSAIQTSAYMWFTNREDPHNSCFFLDEEKLFCGCDFDYCSSDCKYVIIKRRFLQKMWKESKVYQTGTEAAKCMAEYERACLNNEIIIGAPGSSVLLYGGRILHS